MEEKEEKQSKNRYSSFVDYVLQRCAKDKSYAAKLRKADNPNTAYQAWELLISMNVDITKENEMRAFSLIGSALSKSKASHDGTHSLGTALRNTLEDKSNIKETSTALRLRRILACTSQEELCLVLRPTLNLILSKSNTQAPLCFEQLLREVRYFAYDDEQTQRVKLKWARDFYGVSREETQDTSEEEENVSI